VTSQASAADAASLARQLVQARVDRTPIPIPAQLSGGSGAGIGFDVQRHHERETISRYGGSTLGLKLGGGDLKALAAMGLTGPLRGPIFSAMAQHSPAILRREDFFVCAVEPEIAVRLAKDVGGHPYLLGPEVLAPAIDAVFPALEVADSRYSDFAGAGPAAILADGCFAGAFISGANIRDWQDIDLAGVAVRLSSSGQEVRTGGGARVMGHPLHALSLAIADLGRTGQKLRAGQVVSLGACTPPYLGKAGEVLVADFGVLGRVQVTLT
jgi:2-keto-4-pentenoate hydratase